METKPNQVATHTSSKPAPKPPTPIDVLRKNMEGEFIVTVENYFRGNKDEALAFKTAAVDYIRKVPKLLDCDRISLLSAFVQIAQFKFMPSSVMGEAYVIPYAKEAKFQLGYQGLVTLLYRTPQVKSITANVVYENDEFDYIEGLEPKLYHKPAAFGKDKGKPVGVYTVAQLEGGVKTFKVMSEGEVMQIKNLSKAKATADSPWNSDKDPFKGMWKKTCLIQHSKFLPKTAEFKRAVELDMEGEGFEKPPYDAGGPAVGKAYHTTARPVDDEDVIDADQ